MNFSPEDDLRRLLFSALKEGRILRRDRLTLAMLFVMPVVFVLILSLALRDAFGPGPGQLPIVIADPDADLGPRLAAILHGGGFAAMATAVPQREEASGRRLAGGQRPGIVVSVPAGSAARVLRRAEQLIAGVSAGGEPVTLAVSSHPQMRPDFRQAAEGAIVFALRRLEIETVARVLEASGMVLPAAARGAASESGMLLFATRSLPAEGRPRIPSAVQQNAPAWILLAMFFLAVPLSVSFVKERAQGTLDRLRQQGVPGWVVLGGKALPYLGVNLLQFGLVLAACVHLLPVIGGERLTLGDSWPALLFVGFASSLAAIGFGSLVAVYARTAEQATTFAATAILILAAVGGVLVPKAVMPDFMQRLAALSPLSWGLDGFIDVFVDGGGLGAVLFEGMLLLAFAAITHLLAIARYRRRD